MASTLVSAFLGGGLTLWLLKHFVPGAFHPESYNRSPATFIAAVGGAATALLALWFWSWWLGRKDNSSQQ